ncbi:MAG: MFS transporter [Chloroflexi bacterium]|nr:MAG: MFS transporter [Chloroflexota bacterium]
MLPTALRVHNLTTDGQSHVLGMREPSRLRGVTQVLEPAVGRLERSPRASWAAVLGAGALALAHTVNDSYAYILPPLLPLLLAQAGLTLGMGAALVAIQQLASAFLQPMFGHWADRSGEGRWMAWVGVLLSGCGAAALGVVPGFAGLGVAMLATGIGSALFHPMSAALVAQAAPPRQRAFWMSIYISAGNFGLGIGPLLVGLVLVQGDLRGTWLLGIPAAIAAGLLWRVAPVPPGASGASRASLLGVLRGSWRVLVPLIGVVAVRSWASTTLVTFLPTLANQRGAPPSEAAQVLTVFLISGAIGGFAGGAAADRLGRDRVVIGSLLLSVPFGVLLGVLGEFGPAFWLAAAASGVFLNGSWISLTVRGQESVPGSIAMMSGLMLGLSVGLGGIAVTPFGLVAERFGLGSVIAATACLPLLGALMMRFVPRPRSV